MGIFSHSLHSAVWTPFPIEQLLRHPRMGKYWTGSSRCIAICSTPNQITKPEEQGELGSKIMGNGSRMGNNKGIGIGSRMGDGTRMGNSWRMINSTRWETEVLMDV